MTKKTWTPSRRATTQHDDIAAGGTQETRSTWSKADKQAIETLVRDWQAAANDTTAYALVEMYEREVRWHAIQHSPAPGSCAWDLEDAIQAGRTGVVEGATCWRHDAERPLCAAWFLSYVLRRRIINKIGRAPGRHRERALQGALQLDDRDCPWADRHDIVPDHGARCPAEAAGNAEISSYAAEVLDMISETGGACGFTRLESAAWRMTRIDGLSYAEAARRCSNGTRRSTKAIDNALQRADEKIAAWTGSPYAAWLRKSVLS